MSKIFGALKFVWKNNRVWLLVSVITLTIFFSATMVATQNAFLANTISTVMGSERRVLKSGDPTKYEIFKPSTANFLYYEPSNLNYTGKSIFKFDNSSKKAKTDTYNEANRLNEKITEEGIVLLKNKGGQGLPIETSASDKKTVSVFGKNSVNLVYGGSGSGGGKTEGAKTIYDSLTAANFDVNPTLKKFYENNSLSGPGRTKNLSMGEKPIGLSTGETPQSSYTDTVKSSYSNYKDVAIVVFSRIGGEGFDLPRTMKNADGSALVEGGDPNEHYLQLDLNERALLSAVGEFGFGKVIVVINCSTSMELGFIEDLDYIDAALWLGSPGYTGVMSLGRIINGTTNPSGRLVDTYARDFRKDPTWKNFAFYDEPGNSKTRTPAGNEYINSSGGKQNEYFIEYPEGIYVGYRYWETRAYEKRGDNCEWWEDHVVYPFGYGQSYTSFKWEFVDDAATTEAGAVLEKDGKITIKVKVTNEGSRAGNDVVQLYSSARYTGASGVEKAHVTLGDFAKTKLLAPKGQDGDSDIVTLQMNVSDMASYDYGNRSPIIGTSTTYKLDSGMHRIYVGENAHAAWCADHGDRSDAVLTRGFSVPVGGFVYDEDPVGKKPVTNRFDNESDYMNRQISGTDTRRSNLSRAILYREDDEMINNLALPNAGRIVDRAFIDSLKYEPDGKDKDENNKWFVDKAVPETGVEKKDDDPMLWDMVKLVDGKVEVADYNDSRWDNLVARLSVKEMASLIGTGNFNSARIDSIGKPRTTDPDGPAGFTNFMGDPTVYETCYYASACVIASTWNKLLAHDMGVMVGLEGIWGNQKGDGRPYSGWYAPAMNIHRTPFSGRNFEYYSEDPYLSGMTGAMVIQGAKKEGVYTYVKHFAVNDQETDRGGICTWATEQALREIYLKPFEIAVKVGKSTAMMSSFNRIGKVWAGGDYRLLTEVLRDEWGFKGMVISDYNTYVHMPADQMIRAGGDLNLIQDKSPTTTAAALTATHVTAMQKACKNILYTVAGSNAMNGMGPDVVWGYKMPLWMVWLIVGNVVLLAGFSTWGFFAIRKSYKKQKAGQAG